MSSSGDVGKYEEEEPAKSVLSREQLGSDEEPLDQWSITKVWTVENVSKSLYKEGMNSPVRGDICNVYLGMSDSAILQHPHIDYPAVTDPGILEALLEPKLSTTYPDDGQELYLHLCSEMKVCPVRMFYNNLLSPVNNISYYGVDPKGVRAMAEALQNNKFVTCLNMTDNFLNDDACYHLGKMLKYNTTLQELILDGCRIGASGMLLLCDNLYVNHTLVALNLARNAIGDSGGAVFARQLSYGSPVKKVNLSKNNLGRETALHLLEVLSWNLLTHLDLSWNNFTDIPSTVKMLELLADSDLLQELYLSFNNFEGDHIAEAISKLLNIPTLNILDLSHNRLKGSAVTIIIAGLINAQNLIALNLSFNPLSPEDAYDVLHNMLTPQIKLQQLMMENVCVHTSFLDLLTEVTRLKVRENFKVYYDHVLYNWTVEGPDKRELILKRAKYLSKHVNYHRVDILQYFLRLSLEWPEPVETTTLIEQFKRIKVHLNKNFVNDLSVAFAGPKKGKLQTVDFNLIADYIKRLWPEKKPMTYPPTFQPISEPGPFPKLKLKTVKRKI